MQIKLPYVLFRENSECLQISRTYSSWNKTGRLPDNKAKEKKQVKFHAGDVCSMRPV